MGQKAAIVREFVSWGICMHHEHMRKQVDARQCTVKLLTSV